MDFASILDGLQRPLPSEDAAPRRTGSTSQFWDVLDGLSRTSGPGGTIDRASLREAYAGGPDLPAPREDALASDDPDDIAFELDLTSVRSLAELKSLRRVFARLNHPDRVAPPLRERANRRMTIANALIDEAAGRLAR